MAMLEGAGADDPRVQQFREMVLAGRIDRIQAGTTAMEKLFNLHTAESAREYVFHHPEDERYVPVNLPEPDLINIKPIGGLVDMDFDGEPLFAPNGREG